MMTLKQYKVLTKEEAMSVQWRCYTPVGSIVLQYQSAELKKRNFVSKS